MTRAFLFLSANTPWVYALAEALSVHASVTTVRFYDWGNFRRLNPQWPEDVSPLRRVTVSLPQGYAGRFEVFFRPVLRGIISRERARLRHLTGTEPVVVCPYPYLAPWIGGVPDQNVVYYNLDDYSLYDLSRSKRTAFLEDNLIRRARGSLCLSIHQVEALRSRHQHVADRIRHFPLGVVDDFLNTEVAAPMRCTVGYVGNLTDRVDWPLVERVATLVPEATFHLVGKLDDFDSTCRVGGWQAARARTLRLANVVYEGAVPQAEVREHYWRYAVNWMPYAMDHPFNIASCPTKIMDALASGRPFVSTNIPEVQLYGDRIAIADGAEMAAKMIWKALGTPPDPAEQVTFARSHSWARRAETFLSFIDETTTSASPRSIARSTNR